MLLLGRAVAFLGYVLPWGQISFWGATVITRLLRVIPVLGPKLLLILWGGFAVDAPTLRRFFALHYLLPLFMLVLILGHIAALHQNGSSRPLRVKTFKIGFAPYFIWKDLVGYGLYFLILLSFVIYYPGIFLDRVNFIPANSLVTPTHIQPEWYFLFFYALLRSIDNKVLGVIIMLAPFIMLFSFILKSRRLGSGFWLTVSIFGLLS